ncbi:hypothetical protein evm_013467 [Chilo suppressalis]|nr:hypothetical protein evm_013467 [Chilo suppressalis]
MARKVAVVTGANKGLGFAIVKGLCERFDGIVYLTARNEDRLLDAVRKLNDLGLQPAYHRLDVTSSENVKEFARYIKTEHGGFDVLVNNAAILEWDEVYPNNEAAKRNIETNYESFLKIEEYLYPLLRDGARVVNISSSCGHLSNLKNKQWIETLINPDLTTEEINKFVQHYLESVKNGSFDKNNFADDGKHAEHRVSKIAVTALTMVQQRKYPNISINAVHPGHVKTDMANGKGSVEPDEAAKVVLYLILEASPNLKGAFVWYNRKLVDWLDPEGDYYCKDVCVVNNIRGCFIHRSARLLVKSFRAMASFGAQAALRSRWSSLIESTSVDVPGEVTDGVRSVVGWLKQASLEVRQVGRRAVSQLSGRGMGDDVLIIHYNDVYNIEQTTNTEPVGGALRFSTAVKALHHLNPLILFSGDAFSPSMLSTFTKGEQMVPVLNEIGTHCAVFGNHDFDFGLDVLSGLVAQSNFPWLMSNVIDNETGRPLGDGKITHALLCNGHKIGLIGLVEQEWLDTLSTINPEEVTFIDFLQAGSKLASQLKQEGCEYVIALTHMRTPNDVKLAEGCNEIDLILGGHDHVYEVLEVNNRYIVKSGTDFRQFSKITITFEGSPRVNIEEVKVTSACAEDQVLKAKVDKYSAMIEGKMDEVLGKFCVPLEGRFSCIRRQECNLGNWVCDVLLAATGADLVILNSGTFRSDQVHAAGDFTLRDLSTIIPMRDLLVVVEATGAVILEVLENAVSKYPSLEGRFPQVAGISFAFDPTKPSGQRVAEQVVKVGDEYLQKDQKYRLAVKQYLYNGNDGFTMLPKCKVLVSEDMCPEVGMAVQNHFAAINVRTGRARPSKHRQSLVTLSRRHSLVKMLDGSELDGPPPLRRASSVATEPTSHPTHHRLTRRASLDDLEQQSCELAPKIDNRIIILDKKEKLPALLAERARWESDTVIREVDDENSP